MQFTAVIAGVCAGAAAQSEVGPSRFFDVTYYGISLEVELSSDLNKSQVDWDWIRMQLDKRYQNRVQSLGLEPYEISVGQNTILGNDDCWDTWLNARGVPGYHRAGSIHGYVHNNWERCCVHDFAPNDCWPIDHMFKNRHCCEPIKVYRRYSVAGILGDGRASSGKVVYVELGVNDGGEGSVAHDNTHALLHALPEDKRHCVLVEPVPHHYESIKKMYGGDPFHCAVIGQPAWIDADKEIDFSTTGSATYGSSIFEKGGYQNSNTISTTKLRTFDFAKYVADHIKTKDFNVLKIDIEGAEYEVLRHLIMTGLACKFAEAQVEMHALYSEETRHLWAVDNTLIWMLTSCGVRADSHHYYWIDELVRHEAHLYDKSMGNCRECQLMSQAKIADRGKFDYSQLYDHANFPTGDAFAGRYGAEDIRGTSGRVNFIGLGDLSYQTILDELTQRAATDGQQLSCALVDPILGRFETLKERFTGAPYGCQVVDKLPWVDATTTLRRENNVIGTFDIARYVAEHVRSDDYNILRIDVGGGEHELLRHLIMTGLACRFSEVEVFFHLLESNKDCTLFATELPMMWMLETCGVKTKMHRDFFTSEAKNSHFRLRGLEDDEGACRDCKLLYEPVPVRRSNFDYATLYDNLNLDVFDLERPS